MNVSERRSWVCRMQWPKRKQACTQGCWGCWLALLPLSLWPEDEQSRSLLCGASSPDPVPKWSQRLGMCVLGAQPVIQPLPCLAVRQPGPGSCWFCSAASSKGAVSCPLRPETEVARGSEWGRHCREGKGWLLGRNTYALWPGAVDRGPVCWETNYWAVYCPPPHTRNELFQAHQPTKKHLLVALPGMTVSTVPLATLWPVLPTPAWTEILSSKNSSLTSWLYRVFSSCPKHPLLNPSHFFTTSSSLYGPVTPMCDLSSWEPFISKNKIKIHNYYFLLFLSVYKETI